MSIEQGKLAARIVAADSKVRPKHDGRELIFRLLDCYIEPIFAGEFPAFAAARCT